MRRSRAGREIGGCQRDVQPDLFLVDDEDVAQAVGGMTEGMDRKALSVERMRGIDYFHGVRGSQMRLADWGINLLSR